MEDLSFRDSEKINPALRFMFKKCSCNFTNMAYWLSVPEFEEEMLRMTKNGIEIRDDTILPVMQEIYQAKLEKRKRDRKAWNQTEFVFGYAKSGIRELRHVIENRNQERSHV